MTTIKGIAIPAHLKFPIRLEEVESTDIDAYRRIIGGDLEVLNLSNPAATLYIDDEGKLTERRPNPRATALLWVHNPAFVGLDIVVGDALLLGPPDDAADDTTIPADLLNLLTNVERFWVEVQTEDDQEWHGDARVYTSWYVAYRWAAIQAQHDEVTEVRVIEAV